MQSMQKTLRLDLQRIMPILLITALTAYIVLSWNSQAVAEAVLNPNQISGTVQFTNQNPDVLAILNSNADGAGIKTGFIRAQSHSGDPALNNLYTYAYPLAQSPTRMPYQLTVESDPAGLDYSVTIEGRLENGNSRYIFGTFEPSPAYPEPAADVNLDINQCASVFEIRFVDIIGTPLTVQGGYILAWKKRTDSPYYNLQAQDYNIPSGVSSDYIIVNGDGSEYKLEISFDAGSDPYSSMVKSLATKYETAVCDQVIPVEVVLSGATQLGQITGEVDMLGELEHNQNSFTRVTANNGPLRNYRYDTVNGTPSSGTYLLENMMISDAEAPPRNYDMFAEMAFGLGYSTQYFRTPRLSSYYNGNVRVEPGVTTDMGNTFVINPGYVSGQIKLAGPPGGSFLNSLYRDADSDYDQNSIPDSLYMMSSGIVATGSTTIAEGAQYSAWGGQARASFEGRFDSNIDQFVGSYRIALGGLAGEASYWHPNSMYLKMIDTDTSDNGSHYQYSWMSISDYQIEKQLITPQSEVTIDRNYCVSEVRIDFRTLSGTIYDPDVRATGTFQGTDYRGEQANYGVTVSYAKGLPNLQRNAAERAHVNITLPQGEYNLTPYVRALNPNGQTSVTEMRAIPLSVGCEQIIQATPELQINLDPVTSDSGALADGSITISGTIGGGGEVAEIGVTHNDNDPASICTNCGVDPSFSQEITLEQGNNTIIIWATGDGVEASVTSNVEYLPTLVIGTMPDLNLQTAPGGSSAVGTYADLQVSGGDGGPYEILCSPKSGNNFPVGTTKVTCSAIDGSSSSATTDFNVTVTALPWPALVIAPISDINLATVPGGTDAVGTYSPIVSGGDGGPYTVNCNPASGSIFAVGSSIVTCNASDGHQNSANTSFSVNVTATPLPEPEQPDNECVGTSAASESISVGLDQNMLWPPNHQMVAIGMNVTGTDKCGNSLAAADLSIRTTIWSDEAEVHLPGNGDGNHAPDATKTNNQLNLRSERQGNGDGRVYLIISEAIDKQTYSCNAVYVPQSKNKKDLQTIQTQVNAALAYCEDTGKAPANFFTIASTTPAGLGQASEEKLQTLANALAKSEKQLAYTNKNLQKYTKRFLATNSSFKKYKSRLSSTNNALIKYKQRLSAVQKAYKSSKNSKQKSKLKKSIQTLSKIVAKFKASKAKYSKTVKNLKTNRAKHAETVKKLKKNRNKLLTKIDDLKQRQDNLKRGFA